jgi:hypothetical protein
MKRANKNIKHKEDCHSNNKLLDLIYMEGNKIKNKWKLLPIKLT